MKKAIGAGLALILVLFLLISCGVPQEKYDELSANLTAAQTQMRSLQAEKLDLQKKIDEGKARVEILNALLLPFLRGEGAAMTEMQSLNLFLDFRDKIKALGDPVLSAKFEAILADPDTEQASRSFYLYLLESITKTLK